jgi:hypothetical protein
VPQDDITNGKGSGVGVGKWWLVGVFSDIKQIKPSDDTRISQCLNFLGWN